MDRSTKQWFASHTFSAQDFTVERLLAAKQQQNISVSVVIPARDEAATVGTVVSQIRTDLVDSGLVDELVVIDSDSTDDTAAVARTAAATVFAASEIATGLSPLPGKGEALWKSLFVTSGDLLVFIDADLTEWGPHFVTGLLGPMLSPMDAGSADSNKISLVKGFYDRLADDLPGPADSAAPQGGRVTELVARPLLNLYWPELSAVVQPLAGEWAIRRSLIESLSIPVGYGVEFATLTDTWRLHGLDAIAQVDLGRRGHRHQNVHDLGVMAAEILATAIPRLPGDSSGFAALAGPAQRLYQFGRHQVGGWQERQVPTTQRPPARTIDRYVASQAAVGQATVDQSAVGQSGARTGS